jgi:hypothetical protein
MSSPKEHLLFKTSCYRQSPLETCGLAVEGARGRDSFRARPRGRCVLSKFSRRALLLAHASSPKETTAPEAISHGFQFCLALRCVDPTPPAPRQRRFGRLG